MGSMLTFMTHFKYVCVCVLLGDECLFFFFTSMGDWPGPKNNKNTIAFSKSRQQCVSKRRASLFLQVSQNSFLKRI